MLPQPDVYALVAGSAEGSTRLTAFDKALLAAGVGNCNLLKVSSILPPGAGYCPNLPIPEGVLLPIAYAAMLSDVPGEELCAGVGVGLGEAGEYGVIMEYHGLGTKEHAEASLRIMLMEAFEVRGRRLESVTLIAAAHTVVVCGCAFAAVPLWYSGV